MKTIASVTVGKTRECHRHGNHLEPCIVKWAPNGADEPETTDDDCPACFERRQRLELESTIMRVWELLHRESPPTLGQVRAAFHVVDKHSAAWAIDGDAATGEQYLDDWERARRIDEAVAEAIK